MVKTPRTRHSGKVREPRTIDLDPKDVTEIGQPADDRTATVAPSEEAGETRDTLLDPVPPPSASTDPEAASPEGDAADDTVSAAQNDTPAPSEDDGRPAASAEDAAPAATEETPMASDEPLRSAPPASPTTPGTATGQPPRKDGLGRVVAGLIGGVAALILAAILQMAGLLGLPGGSSGGADVQSQIDGLRAEVDAVKTSVGDGSPGAAELASSLDAVRRDVAALQEALSAGAGGEAPALQALDQRVGEIESAIAGLGAGANAQDAQAVAALGDRLSGVEEQVKSAQEASDTAAAKLATLEQSVSALTARVDSQAAQPKIAMAIGAAALKSAVDRGAPFVAELETFAAIAPDAPEIASLRPYAENGVATREVLRGEMEAAAAAMIAAANPADPDAGYFERLLQSAESLVTVRPIGEVPGSGVPETVARMEVALDAGDLDKAIAEYESLPESAMAAGTAFADRLKARRDVETLVDRAIANAMKA